MVQDQDARLRPICWAWWTLLTPMRWQMKHKSGSWIKIENQARTTETESERVRPWLLAIWVSNSQGNISSCYDEKEKLFFFKYLHCLMFVSMRQFSSNILNSFFPGLGCHSHLSWVTWKETNLKMKLLTETERSGCADAPSWRVLMFLKIFSSSILSSVEYLLTWSGYKSRWMPLTVFYFIWNIKYVDKQHKKSAYVAHTTKRRPFLDVLTFTPLTFSVWLSLLPWKIPNCVRQIGFWEENDVKTI